MAYLNLKYLHREFENWWVSLLPAEFKIEHFNIEEDWSDHAILLGLRVSRYCDPGIYGFTHKIPYTRIRFQPDQDLTLFLFKEAEMIAGAIRDYFAFGSRKPVERSVRLIRFRKVKNERSHR